MRLTPVEKKWWFWAPVIVATVCTMFWMFSVLGIDMKLYPFSFPKTLLYLSSFFSFERFYSFILRLALALITPTPGDEKKVAS